MMGKEFQKEIRGHTLRQALSYFTFLTTVSSYVKSAVRTNCGPSQALIQEVQQRPQESAFGTISQVLLLLLPAQGPYFGNQ